MKKMKMMILAMSLAAISAVSACSTAEAAIPSAPSQQAATQAMVRALETNPDPYADSFVSVPAETSAEISADTTTTADNLPESEETTDNTTETTDSSPETTDNSYETTELNIEDIEPYFPGEDLGEYKDESYWDRMLDTGNDDDKTENKVFLISVDAGTTDEMMNGVIADYGLTVVYDYENFNMYAVAVPEALNKRQSDDFIAELTEHTDFILFADPDSIAYLDSSANDISLF